MVRAARKQGEHTGGIGIVVGLAQDPIVDGHHGVGGDDKGIVVPLAAGAEQLAGGATLTQRKLAHKGGGVGDVGTFVGIGADDIKGHPEGGEDLAAAGGFGGQNDAHYFTPVEPKPPAPRSVSSRVSALIKPAVRMGMNIICAMRSPRQTVKGSLEVLKRPTQISPR